jgi:hypothetical protein
VWNRRQTEPKYGGDVIPRNTLWLSTHHAESKHCTQNSTNNKGHYTHNEFNANTIKIYYNSYAIKNIIHAILSRTVSLAFPHDLLFIPLCYTYLTLTSSPQFTSIYLTLLSFTWLHLISLLFRLFPPRLHFASFITFPIIFLKLLGFQNRVPKASAGSWFQSCMVLLKKEIFSDVFLCFLLLILLSWANLLR